MKLPQVPRHIAILNEQDDESLFFFYVEGKLQRFDTLVEAQRWCEEHGYSHQRGIVLPE